MSDKQLILNTVQKIDDALGYEEILYTLYVQLETQKGIRDMEAGNVKRSNEVKEIISKWQFGLTMQYHIKEKDAVILAVLHTKLDINNALKKLKRNM